MGAPRDGTCAAKPLDGILTAADSGSPSKGEDAAAPTMHTRSTHDLGAGSEAPN